MSLKTRLFLSNLFLIVGFLLLILTFWPVIRDEVWYRLKEFKNQRYLLNDPNGKKDSVFARYLSAGDVSLFPVDPNFSIVIEKIGINAPVVADVPVMDQQAYQEALKHGVAHAASSAYPSKNAGNVYLFAHASVNFWQLGRYATTFNLLRKLEKGDEVHVFYKGTDYVYKVLSKEIFPGWDTFPLNRAVIQPVLTLQTCDPPGTTINRLVVTATLSKVNE